MLGLQHCKTGGTGEKGGRAKLTKTIPSPPSATRGFQPPPGASFRRPRPESDLGQGGGAGAGPPRRRVSRFRGRRPPRPNTGVGAHARRGLALACTPARLAPREAAVRRASCRAPRPPGARTWALLTAAWGRQSNPKLACGSRSLLFSKVSALSAAGLRAPGRWCSVGHCDQSRTIVGFLQFLKNYFEGLFWKVFIKCIYGSAGSGLGDNFQLIVPILQRSCVSLLFFSKLKLY